MAGVVTSIYTSFTTSMLMSDGTLYMCGSVGGYYPNRNIGPGMFFYTSNLSQITDFQITDSNGGVLKPINSIAHGSGFAVMISTDNFLYAIGGNYFGQLGTRYVSSVYDRGKEYLTLTPPPPFSSDNILLRSKTPKKIECGEGYTFVLCTDGTLWGCGADGAGQLGLPPENGFPPDIGEAASAYYEFVQISYLTSGGKQVIDVLARSARSAVLMSDKTVLVTGNGTNRFTLVPNSTGKTIKSIALGAYHTIALMTDNTLWGIGENYFGQLGLNNTVDALNWTRITNLSGKTPSSIYCGNDFTFVLMTDNTLYSTGHNNASDGRLPGEEWWGSGQLGLGDTNNRYVLTKVTIPNNKTPKLVACGDHHVVVAMTDNTFYGCGDNYAGQVGSGGNLLTLTQITALTGSAPSNLQCTSIPNRTTLAITFDGSTGSSLPAYDYVYKLWDNVTYLISAPLQGTTRSLSFDISGLTLADGQTWYLQLYGRNNSWPENTPFSDTLTILIVGLSANGSAPSNVTATTTSSSAISVSFGASTGGSPAVSAYYYKLNGGAYTGPVTSPFSITGLTTGTSYSVIVYAYNATWPTQYIASSTATATTYGNGSAPSNITATTTSSSAISVSFGASTGGNPAVSAYYYKLNGGAYIGPVSSPFSITGLTPGTSYSIVVYAYNTNWPTQYIASSTATATTYINGSAPSNVTATSTSSTAISVSFGASTGGNPAVSAYYYKLNGSAFIGPVSSPFSITGLTPGAAYTIVAYAYNTNWPNQYIASSTVIVATYGNGSAPSNVTATAISSTAISVSFGASTGGSPAVSAYYYKLDGGAYIGPVSSPFSITGLTPGTSYSIVVYAYNTNWPTQYIASSTVNASPYGNGTAPAIQNIYSTFTQFTVTYSPSSNGVPPASAYYYTLNGGSYIGPVTSPSYIVPGLNPGTSYSIIVYAYNANWPNQYIASSQFSKSTLPPTLTTYYSASTDVANIVKSLNVSSGFNPNYLTNGSNNFNTLMLYVFGTRSEIGYKLTGFDIGRYFQKDSVIYSCDLGDYRIAPWGQQNASFQYARWIWNDPNANTSAVANVYLWFYYSFYYNGTNNTGKVYAMCDNIGEFWFNGVDIGSISGGVGTVGNIYNIPILNGLNCIRISAYNQGSGAGLLASLYDSASNHIISTNSDWVVTISTNNTFNSGAAIFNN